MAICGRIFNDAAPRVPKILTYLDLGKQEGAKLLAGGAQAHLPAELAGGYYVQPTLFKGHNKMRVFQEEIFGPVLAVTTFKTEAEALAIANDTLYGLGAGDVLLGEIGGCPFYIGKSQFEYWQHTQLIIDVVDGQGGTFSLEGPEGKAFHTRSRVFSEAEWAELEASTI